MNDAYTFKTTNGKWSITVEKVFLNKCSNPKNLDIRDLVVDYKINHYFHNTEGPAIIRLEDGRKDYWLYGELYKEKSKWEKEKDLGPPLDSKWYVNRDKNLSVNNNKEIMG